MSAPGSSPERDRTSAPTRSARSASPACLVISSKRRSDRLSGTPGASHIHQFFGNTGTNAELDLHQPAHHRRLDLHAQRHTVAAAHRLLDAGDARRGRQCGQAGLDQHLLQAASGEYRSGVRDHARSARWSGTASRSRTASGSSSATTWRRGSGGPTDIEQPRLLGDGLRLHGSCDRQHQLHRVKHSLAEIVATGLCPVGAWLRVFGNLPTMLGRQESRQRQPPQPHHLCRRSRRCPGTHPYKVPEVAVSAFYTDRRQFRSPASGCCPTTMLNHGDAGGRRDDPPHGLLGSLVPIIKPLWQTNCIDGHLSCSTGKRRRQSADQGHAAGRGRSRATSSFR
jgi:hypothetical protein